MSAYNDRRRDVKRAYRKKAFQTDMSLIKDTVDNNPPPPHSYSTQSHVQTAPVRKGIDPHTYTQPIRPTVETKDFKRLIDTARAPWHLFPKADSANVIARNKYSFASGNVTDGQYLDVLVLNVADVAGANIATPTASTGLTAADRGPVPNVATEGLAVSDGISNDTGQNPSFPGDGGTTRTGVTGQTSIVGPGEIYRVGSFGHSEVVATNLSAGTAPTAATPIVYQVWIDGSLFIEWTNFQWSPVTPLRDQWHWSQPLTVTEQLVFRIINQSGQTINAGEIEASFNGWSEQLSGYIDVSYQQLAPTT